jgi:hypothetical protein
MRTHQFFDVAMMVILLAAGTCARAADTDLAGSITAICSSPTSTPTGDLLAKCDAAKGIFLDQLLLANANAVAVSPVTSVQKKLSETAVLDAQIKAVTGALSLNSETLAAIRPTTVTVPDMTASTYAALVSGLGATAAANAQRIAGAIRTSGSMCSNPHAPKVLALMTDDLSALRKTYMVASDAITLLDRQITSHSEFMVRTFDDPSAWPREPLQSPAGGRTQGGLITGAKPTSATAILSGAGLLVDVVTKAAAAIAAFRPVASSSSATLNAEVQNIAEMALLAAIAEEKLGVVRVGSIFPGGEKTGADGQSSSHIRRKLAKLDANADMLRRLFDNMSHYEYGQAAARALIDVPLVDAKGKPLPKDVIKAAKDEGREQLQERSKRKQVLLEASVTAAKALLQARHDLSAAILVGKPAKEQLPASEAAVFAFDQWEAAQLDTRCVFTLTLKTAVAQADRLAVQRAFGGPRYHYTVSGVLPWLLASDRGEVIAAGALSTSSEWAQFGPSK